MYFGHNCDIILCHLFHIVNLVSHFLPVIYVQTEGICCERNSSYSFVPIVLKLCTCFLHGMRMCMWFEYNC